jgi:acyl-CoA hydrolase
VYDNPEVVAAPLEYVNGLETLGQIKDLISINNCIAVDLNGQISSESSGPRQMSGTGGQLDFVTGSVMAPNGKAFICLTSTFKDKQGQLHSRIVSDFNGDIITVPRTQAYYIVTEFGAVNLAGRSLWERAERLISVAHPDFRDELIKKAEERHIWRRSNKI